MNDEERREGILRLLKETRNNWEDAAERAEELPNHEHVAVGVSSGKAYNIVDPNDIDMEIDEAKDAVERALALVRKEASHE